MHKGKHPSRTIHHTYWMWHCDHLSYQVAAVQRKRCQGTCHLFTWPYNTASSDVETLRYLSLLFSPDRRM